ncbi:MAG: MaoC family dehydratase [Deltaproteobacteria bacterium]|nr:MaoC family dehydratase [Deltaproteobacteria bacterium]
MPKVGDLSGYYYEDYEVGAIFKHWPGRTVTQSDNVFFTLMTLNTHPLHFDVEYASKTEFGKPLVNSTFTLALIAGMSVTDISQNAICNLGWEEIKIPKPTFEGDTLYSETTVLSRRESKSRPNCGIIRVETVGKNQKEEVVLSFIRTILVKKKPIK